MTRCICLVALILPATLLARSDTPTPSSAAVSGGGGSYTWYEPSELGPCRLTPAFSADVVHETEQRFADGNRIYKVATGKIYRDSAGRRRSEVPCFSPAPDDCRQITIMGPERFIFLDSVSKTAHVQRLGEPPQSTKPVKVGDKQTGTISRRPAPAITNLRTTNSEDLGQKQIEGFTVTGKRHTTTLPAGADGNEKPIISTNEVWESEDLNETLERIDNNPWTGKQTTTVRNIQLGEPDPALFEVPPDYKVQENGDNNAN